MFDLGNIKQAVQDSDSTRCKTYKDLNPTLCVSPIYSAVSGVPEYARVAATRMRLSSHNLKIETGSRLPRENRTCTCGAVQTEEHVLLKCPRTLDLRLHTPGLINVNTITDFFSFTDISCVSSLCVFCAKVLKMFS